MKWRIETRIYAAHNGKRVGREQTQYRLRRAQQVLFHIETFQTSLGVVRSLRKGAPNECAKENVYSTPVQLFATCFLATALGCQNSVYGIQLMEDGTVCKTK